MAKWYEEGFFQTPKLLRGMVANSEYEKERDTTWTELFADLIFVTAIARIGKGKLDQIKDTYIIL